ncbi:ubiquitinyl hydrolase [Aureococcus anophagefferens]|nr:ubiquitinyl hydrolase [Aureococcus anophagefferens]
MTGAALLPIAGVTSDGLANRLRAVGRSFRRGRQEDAHEFLRALLDAAEPGFAPLEAPSSKANPVSAIFGGRAPSTLCCPKCGYKSATEEPFLDLSLEPKPSLARALDAFTAPEKLDAKNAWRCGGCSEPARATKRLGVAAAPEALVVHLKRFDARGRVARKVDAHVAFGARLELKTTDGGAAPYGLVGVLVHHGQSTHSGHYTAFCRTRSGAWSSFDDDAARKRVVAVSHGYPRKLAVGKRRRKRLRLCVVDEDEEEEEEEEEAPAAR